MILKHHLQIGNKVFHQSAQPACVAEAQEQVDQCSIISECKLGQCCSNQFAGPEGTAQKMLLFTKGQKQADSILQTLIKKKDAAFDLQMHLQGTVAASLPILGLQPLHRLQHILPACMQMPASARGQSQALHN